MNVDRITDLALRMQAAIPEHSTQGEVLDACMAIVGLTLANYSPFSLAECERYLLQECEKTMNAIKAARKDTLKDTQNYEMA